MPSFERYTHAEAVGRFVEQATRMLSPLALILFGSLARGDCHQRSDADFCVVPTPPPGAKPGAPAGSLALIAVIVAGGIGFALWWSRQRRQRK